MTSKRRLRLADKIARFSRNMSKKSRDGADADQDDRRTERKTSRYLMRMDPEEFDELLKSDGLE